MKQEERMLKGLPYKITEDGLPEKHLAVLQKIYDYNLCRPDETEKMDRLIRSILGKTGKQVHVEPPFRCDYGFNIEVGENFYSNYNLTILDCNKVTIGHHCLIGPNVSIITVNHPQDRKLRSRDLEYATPVTIGNDVWMDAVPSSTLAFLSEIMSS